MKGDRTMNKKTKKPTLTLEWLQKFNVIPFDEKPWEFDKLKTSKAYMIWEKSVTDPKSLTREEKDWVFEQFCYNGTMNAIHIGGWAIIYPTVRTFLVQSDNWRDWKLYSAFDKTSIRKQFRGVGGCREIIEYTKKEAK